MSDLIQELTEATGVSWDAYKARFPQTAARMEARVKPAITIAVDNLARDEGYQALLAETESEMDRARIITAIGDVIVRLAPMLLAAL